MSEHLLENLLIFVRALRADGIAVAADATVDAVRALQHVGIERRDDVRAALGTVLVNGHDDLVRFDRLFERFWRTWPAGLAERRLRPLQTPRRATTKIQWVSSASEPLEDSSSSEIRGDVPVQTYSAAELWRTKDFAAYEPDDVARAREAIAQLTWTPGSRLTRRWEAGGARTIDLRHLLPRNARYGGEPLVIPFRRRRLATRPLVVLCDVSGSMEPYTRMLLLLLHALARRRRALEIFVFSTRLTRITRVFADRPLDAALLRLRDDVRDWSGGTRIGEALRTFNVVWARRMLRRGPVVLLISDGWDLGEPELLAAETARLRRESYRLIWLNPLVGSPGYEPLTRGMRAALPFVHDFLPVRNMASLESLAAHLNRLPSRGRSDPRSRVN